MSSEGEGVKITDVLGIQPVAKAIEAVTEKALEGAGAVFSRLCLPAAKELGMLFKDQVAGYRKRNAVTLARKLEEKLAENKVPENAHMPPRLMHKMLDEGTWIDDSVVQDMWAGLMSSSCTNDGEDDSNLIFTNLLGSITKMQATILRHACIVSLKTHFGPDFIQASPLILTLADLKKLADTDDVPRLDREIDHLKSLSLIEEQIEPRQPYVLLTPTPLALHMFVRCEGSRKSPVEFFIKQPGEE